MLSMIESYNKFSFKHIVVLLLRIYCTILCVCVGFREFTDAGKIEFVSFVIASLCSHAFSFLAVTV